MDLVWLAIEITERIFQASNMTFSRNKKKNTNAEKNGFEWNITAQHTAQ